MPLILIQTNAAQFPTNFLQRFSTEFGQAVGKNSNDIEICLTSPASFHFNGDSAQTAAYIEYKTTDAIFGEKERRNVVKTLSKLIKDLLGIRPSRLFIRLEQLKSDDVGISGQLFSDLVEKAKL